MTNLATRLSIMLSTQEIELQDDVTLLLNELMKSMIRRDRASMSPCEEHKDASIDESNDDSKRANAKFDKTERNQSFGSVDLLSNFTGSDAGAVSASSGNALICP
jgi:hypothetical protein